MAQGRKTGGRVKGTPNKATAEVKAYAQQFTTAAIDALVSILQHGQVEVARVAAARELLDRAIGKVPQAITDGDGEPLRLVPETVKFVISKAPGADRKQ